MSAIAPAVTASGRMAGTRRLDRLVSIYLPLLLVLVFLLAPFYWMTITAFKPNSELYDGAVSPLVVYAPTTEHFEYLWTRTDFIVWTWNTMFVAIASTAISIFFGVPAGYALARLRFRGADTISLAVFSTYLIPTTLLFIPMVQVMKVLDLLDTVVGLVVVYPTFLLPFTTWLMSGYFKTIPAELEECARIDGASRIVAMLRIAFPLAMPGIVSAGIFCFTLSWNEFIYALTLITASSERTIPTGVLVQLTRADFYFWGPLMAGALLGSVPVALIYSFFVDQYAAGLTAGAVKG
jgi:multiple sugar transport system permease protein